MKRIFIIAGIIASVAIPLVAQNVKGKVVDPDQQPVEAVTVIMQTQDSTFIDAVITDSLGYFSFKENPEQYRLIFQHLLFKTQEKEGNTPEVGTVTLQVNNYTLNEVVIRGERPHVKVEKGKLIYDVNLLTERTSVSNAYESLLRIPGIVEQNNAISLTGTKEVTVILNGKPSSMNTDQLMEVLKSTPVSQIQNMEVMYNAPAKYRVRGAVINVVLKNTKSNDPFLRGEISGNYTQSAYASGGGNLSLSYSGKKVSTDLNYSPQYSHADNNVDVISDHTVHTHTYQIRQENDGVLKALNHNLRFGMDYQISEGNNLNAAYTASFKTHGEARQRSTGNFSQSDNLRTSQSQMHNVNVDFTANFGLNLGLDYTHYNSPSMQDFTNQSDEEKQHFFVDEHQSIDCWNVYAGQVQSLPNNWSLNYGINFTFANEKSGQTYHLQDGSTLPSLSTNTKMKEETYNFYAGTEKTFNEQLSLSISIAGERYKLMNYKKWAIYPTFQLGYQLNPSHIFQLGFSSDKIYPSYWTLQNTTSYMNGYMKIIGNPNLIPSTDYTTQLTYIFKGKYMANFYYSYIKDLFMQLPYQSPDELSLIYQYINYDYEQNIGLTFMIPLSAGELWNAQLVLDGSYNKDVCRQYHDISFHRTNVRGIAQLNNSFHISSQPDIRLELNGVYASPTLQGFYDLSSIWKIDAGLKWTFANQRAELKLQGNDLFNSSTPDGSIDYKGQKLDMKLDNMTRSLVVTFTYKFNGYKKAQYKEVDTSRFGH